MSPQQTASTKAASETLLPEACVANNWPPIRWPVKHKKIYTGPAEIQYACQQPAAGLGIVGYQRQHDRKRAEQIESRDSVDMIVAVP